MSPRAGRRLLLLLAALAAAAAARAASPAATPAASPAASPTASPAASANAAPPPADDDQQVEVIGRTPLPGSDQPLSHYPGLVQSAGAAELRDSQALDASELLERRFSSVSVNAMQGNPLQADLNFRGFTASPLLGTPQGLSVYLDGVRLNQPFGDVVSWDLIPRDALARVSLLPGSDPLFGLNTLGGALVLETRDGRDSPGGELSLQLGSGARRVLEGHAGADLGGGWDLFVAGQSFAEAGWRDFSASRQRQLYAKLGWRDGRRTVKLSLAQADTALGGNGLQEQRFLARRWAGVFSQPDLTRNHASLLELAATQALGGGATLSGNTYARALRSAGLNGDVNGDALDQNLWSTEESPATVPFPQERCAQAAAAGVGADLACDGLLSHSRTRQQTWGAGLQWSRAGTWAGLAQHASLGAAFEASRIGYTQASEFGSLTADHGVLGSGALADGSGGAPDARVDLAARTRTASLYASDRLTLAPGWHLNLGGRWNDSRLVMQDRLVAPGTGSLSGSHRWARFNPALGLVAELRPGLGAYASASRGSRTPTATELGCADPADPCRLPNAMASDPPLQPVRVDTVEAGLRGRAGALRWHLGAFRADSRDDIVFVAAGASGGGYFRNVGRTRRQGLEASLGWRRSTLEAGLSLSLLDATFRDALTLAASANSSNDLARSGAPGLAGGVIQVHPGDRLPLLPRAILKLHAQWQAAPAWSLGADLRAVGGSLARGNENGLDRPDGRVFLGSGRSAGYAVVDLRLRWAFAPGWSLAAKLDNLLDRRYTSAATLGATPYDGAGRVSTQQLGSHPNGAGGQAYAVQQTTLAAPGAPRQAFITLAREFD
ncbi:MAG: TonB-dependent receptor [Burkholderiales bacterium]|nr:TonB-dependent receptor [Burkholderiales bacterium]